MSVPGWPSKDPTDYGTPSARVPPTTREGRIARSSRLVGESWRYLDERPKLLVLPAISALACMAASVAVFLPVLHALHPLPLRARDLLAGVALALPLTFVTVFANVGFLTMVREHQAGMDPSIRRGLAAAAALTPAIAAWSVLTWAVGSVLGLLEQLPLVGGLAGRIVGLLGGLAWGLATFFVVPVLVLEQRGALGSIRRSAQTVRHRWGEAVAGDIGIGAVFGLLMLPGTWMLIAGLTAHGGGTLWCVLGLIWIAPLVAISSALGQLFTLELYRDAGDGPWSRATLAAAVRPRRRRWWQRAG